MTAAHRAQDNEMTEEKVTRETYENEPFYFNTMNKWYHDGLYAERIDNILGLLPDSTPAGARVLDAGTAIGTFALEMADRTTGPIVGVDFAQTAIEIARNNARLKGVDGRVEFIHVDDVCSMHQFEDASFDVIIAADLIEHLYSPLDFFREAARLLAANGVIVLETPNMQSQAHPGYQRIKSMFALPESTAKAHYDESHPDFKDYSLLLHVHCYTYEQLVDHLCLAHFQIEKLECRGWWRDDRGIDRFITRILGCDLFDGKLVYHKNTDILCAARKVDAVDTAKNMAFLAEGESHRKFLDTLYQELELLLSDVSSRARVQKD